MDNWSGQRLSLETDLRHALEREQLVLHYQPQVDLTSGRLIGCEALLRWQHPERGLIPPAAFIPLAEESGLIVPVGIWVMHEAWQQLAIWRCNGTYPNRIAVNLSPRQFLHNHLVKDIEQVLKQAQVPPICLELEITETLLMQDIERTIDCLKTLETMGLRLAIDDFGTGYSSLNYLKKLPIHCLKIDQSFVRDITIDADDAAIASTVIAMAHNMRLEVIAEGVETEAQLGFLRARNCNAIQGYYISRPLSTDEFTQWMKSSPPRLLKAIEPQTHTILIVDDDTDMLALLSLYLEQDDYRIITADNGCEGLNIMARTPVDVVLTDYSMPDMNGTEFLRLASAIHPQTVRIMLSASRDIKVLAQAVNDGALFRFLFKPVDEMRLRDTVREAFLIRYKT